MESMIESFTLARPWWLLALVPVLIGLYFFIQRVRSAQQWNKHIAPELLSQLTDNDSSSSKPYWLSSIVFLVSLLAVIALSGPSFKSNQVQSLQTDDTLVVILDLSLSMLAEDVKPSRLQRVKFKLQDLLEKRKTGYTALIVYSGDAHVVVPLTEDTETIEHLAKSLNPWMIPSKGSRLYRAIEEANKLLEAYPSSNSRILLFTDEISNAQLNKSLEISQHPTYVVGVGSASGAPIPLPDGKLLKDDQQNIVIAKLHKEQVNALANKTGGSYNPLSINDSDIEDALNFEPSDQSDRDEMNELAAVKDFGYVLLIPLFFLMLLSFRKGWILVLPLFLIQPNEAFSAEANAPEISFWDSLWKNQSQQAQSLLDQGEYNTAAELFDDPTRKGSAYAKAQDWQKAEEAFQQANPATATTQYNLANVQAQQGKLDEAIERYDSAIEHAEKEDNQTVLERARKDKALLEQLKDQQQQNENQQQSQDDQQNQQDSGEQQNSQDKQDGSSENKDSSSENQEGQSGDQQSGNQQNQKQSQQNPDSSNDQNQSGQDQDGESNQDQQSQKDQKESDQQSEQDQSNSGTSEQQEDSSLDEQSAQQAAQKANDSSEELERQATAQNAQASESEAPDQEPSGVHDYQAEGRPQPLSQEEIDEQKYQQTLRKIQTDPSILLENKFKIQHYQRNKPANESQVW